MGKLKCSCLGVMILSLLACSESRVDIVNGVNQKSANSIILDLEQSHITTTKLQAKDGTYSIQVPKNKQMEALAILKQNGEPFSDYVSIGTIFKKEGFISSPLEEHARLIYALNQEIDNMLMSISGVIQVKTQVSLPLPNDNLWQTDLPHSSASVLIKYKPGSRIDLYLARMKNLVANAVPGLTPDRVEIITVQQNDSSL